MRRLAVQLPVVDHQANDVVAGQIRSQGGAVIVRARNHSSAALGLLGQGPSIAERVTLRVGGVRTVQRQFRDHHPGAVQRGDNGLRGGVAVRSATGKPERQSPCDHVYGASLYDFPDMHGRLSFKSIAKCGLSAMWNIGLSKGSLDVPVLPVSEYPAWSASTMQGAGQDAPGAYSEAAGGAGG